MPKIESLEDLLVDQLRDLYNSEKLLLKALPTMAEASSSPELRKAFETHRQETETHVDRLENVFAKLKTSPQGTPSPAMEGLIQGSKEWISEKAPEAVRDAGLIASAQRIEHYEIAGYGCVRTYAKILGQLDAANILGKTLDEESSADIRLTYLAEKLNLEASGVFR